MTDGQVINENYAPFEKIGVICASDPTDNRCSSVHYSTQASQRVWDLKYNQGQLRRSLEIEPEDFDSFLVRIVFVPTIQDAINLRDRAMDLMRSEFGRP